MNKNTKYSLFLTLLYFIVSLVGILHHELWLDEAHHWLLARDSTSIANLFENTRYEGHPILWNVLLYFISRFTLNPFWMQFLHIMIATATAFLLLRKAPFPMVWKTLFIFGYFMIFEYNIISRNYILGIFFLFLVCSVFQNRQKKFILLCLYLALAANTHLIFIVISFALFLTIAAEQFQTEQAYPKSIYLTGYAIVLTGFALAIIQILPPDDTRFFNHVHEMALPEKFSKGFISLFKALVTIPDFRTIHFWNSNFLVNLSKPVSAVIGLCLYAVPLLLFFKSRKTLFFVYTALIGTQIFFFITQMSATRYDGMGYVIFIVAFWIEAYYPEDHYRLQPFVSATPLRLFRKPFIVSILLLQFCSGLGAYAIDFKYPFTATKETNDYLKSSHLSNSEMVSVTCDGTAISPYLQKKVYFLCDQSYQSYCRWNVDCAPNITQEYIIGQLTDYMRHHTYAVYVSGYPIVNCAPNIWKNINGEFKVRFLKKFDHDIVRNSHYYVFEVSRL